MAEKAGTEPVVPTPAEGEAGEQEPKEEQNVEFWKAKANAADREAKKAAERMAKRLAELEAKEKERAEAEMSEVEKYKAKLAEAEKLRTEAERKALRQKVASEVGLAPIFAERLQGDDEDAMKADAAKMLEALPKPTDPKKPVQPIINPTNPASAQHTENDAEMRERLHLNDVSTIWKPREGGLTINENKE
jgi:hypothetical protein